MKLEGWINHATIYRQSTDPFPVTISFSLLPWKNRVRQTLIDVVQLVLWDGPHAILHHPAVFRRFLGTSECGILHNNDRDIFQIGRGHSGLLSERESPH
jgi:hypothetical protein